MEIGLFMDTHGLVIRRENDIYIQEVPAEDMRPVQIAQLAERLDYHSVWFSDHVLMTLTSTSAHVANPESRKRAYPERPNMLDAAVVMGGVAASTSRIKMAPSVLIAPYRNPLSDARQLVTVDVLSSGRLIVGVGSGWMKEEFDALGLPYEDRLAMTEECIEIYKRSWTQDVVEFHGRFYNFENVSMDPKPVQKPRPPIIFGGISKVTARLAVRHCDGFFPIFLDPHAGPDRYGPVQDEIRGEAEKIGRELSNFTMMGCVSAFITDAAHPSTETKPRLICTGTAEQILSDLERFADAGYSLMVVHLVCPSGEVRELQEQIERFGKEVIPLAKNVKPKGEWKTDL